MASKRWPPRTPAIFSPAFVMICGFALSSPAYGFTFLNGAEFASRVRTCPTKRIDSKELTSTGSFSLNPLTSLAASPDIESSPRDTRSSSGDVFILSYDGAVADTAETNALLAIDAALSIWPELIQLYVGIGDEDPVALDEGPELEVDGQEGDIQCNVAGSGGDWLLNKMIALTPAMGSDPDAQMGCDAVLLARMLLEEQKLDSGRSAGCKGKYGSKFHPSSPAAESKDESDAGTSRDWRGNANGSRPLTVGEVRANWSTGALLRETARVRYNIDGQDPIPIIREEIELLRREENAYPTPILSDTIVDFLSSVSSVSRVDQKIVAICVGHACHIPMALESLSRLNTNVRVVESMEDELSMLDGGIVIVPPRHDRDSHREIVQRITEQVAASALGSREGSEADAIEVGPTSVYLVHSSPGVLDDCKRRLLGDDRPRLINGCLRTPLANGLVNISLLLPSWAQNVDKQHQNDAEMDPWLDVLSEKVAKKLMVGSETESGVIEAAPFS